jgi:hypothetical protein
VKLCRESASSTKSLNGEKSLKKTHARCALSQHLVEVSNKSQRGRAQGVRRDIFEKISKSKIFQKFKGCKECSKGLK